MGKSEPGESSRPEMGSFRVEQWLRSGFKDGFDPAPASGFDPVMSNGFDPVMSKGFDPSPVTIGSEHQVRVTRRVRGQPPTLIISLQEDADYHTSFDEGREPRRVQDSPR